MHTTELQALHGWRAFEPRSTAVQLAVHSLNLSARLPADEQANLAQQIRRSAVSVASNVAEGYARRTARGYAHYIMVAFEIALRAGYLANEDLTDVMPLVERIAISLTDIVRVLGPEAASE